MFGNRSFRFLNLFGTTVHTNLEAVGIMLATGFAGDGWLEAILIVASFAVGTGLHLGSHWAVALAFGNNIDRMVLTRAGRIDYTGAPPGLFEDVLRTSAGPTMNALNAVAAYGVLAYVDTGGWPHEAQLGLSTFAACSLILTAVNFFPAIPLDGGLILKALIGRFTTPGRALRIATWISLVLMAGVFAYGVWAMQPVLVYLAVVISYDNWRTHLRVPPPDTDVAVGG
ncbi:MAG: site-2 protease family protein [Sandaracinaceae bacterium]